MPWLGSAFRLLNYATDQIINDVVTQVVEGATSAALDKLPTPAKTLLTSSLITAGQAAITSISSLISGFVSNLSIDLSHSIAGMEDTELAYRTACYTPTLTSTMLLHTKGPPQKATDRYVGLPAQVLYPGIVSHTFAPETMLMASHLRDLETNVNLSRAIGAAAPYDLGMLTQLLARTYTTRFTDTVMPDVSLPIAVALHLVMSRGTARLYASNPEIVQLINSSFGTLVTDLGMGNGPVRVAGMCPIPYVQETRTGAAQIAHFIGEALAGRGVHYDVNNLTGFWTYQSLAGWIRIHGFTSTCIYQLGVTRPDEMYPIPANHSYHIGQILHWLSVHAPPQYVQLALYHLASTSLRCVTSDIEELGAAQELPRVTPRHAEVTLTTALASPAHGANFRLALPANAGGPGASGRVYLPEFPVAESMLFFALQLRARKDVGVYAPQSLELLFRNISMAMSASADIDLTTLNSFPYASGPGDTHAMVKQIGLDQLAERRYVTTVPRGVDAMNVPWVWSAPSLHNFPQLEFSPKDRFGQRGRLPGFLTEAYLTPVVPIRTREERAKVKPRLVPNTFYRPGVWDQNGYLGGLLNPGDVAEIAVTIPGLRGPYQPAWIRYGTSAFYVRNAENELSHLVTQRTRDGYLDLDYGPELGPPEFLEF